MLEPTIQTQRDSKFSKVWLQRCGVIGAFRKFSYRGAWAKVGAANVLLPTSLGLLVAATPTDSDHPNDSSRGSFIASLLATQFGPSYLNALH